MNDNRYFTFYRESNDFSDILSDTNIKKHINTKMTWRNHLLIAMKDSMNNSVMSYINLKYNDDMVKLTSVDYTPIPYKDYIPKKP